MRQGLRLAILKSRSITGFDKVRINILYVTERCSYHKMSTFVQADIVEYQPLD